MRPGDEYGPPDERPDMEAAARFNIENEPDGSPLVEMSREVLSLLARWRAAEEERHTAYEYMEDRLRAAEEREGKLGAALLAERQGHQDAEERAKELETAFSLAAKSAERRKERAERRKEHMKVLADELERMTDAYAQARNERAEFEERAERYAKALHRVLDWADKVDHSAGMATLTTAARAALGSDPTEEET